MATFRSVTITHWCLSSVFLCEKKPPPIGNGYCLAQGSLWHERFHADKPDREEGPEGFSSGSGGPAHQ